MRAKSPDFTPEYLRTILDYEPITGVFRWKVDRGPVKSGDIAGTIHHLQYRHIKINGRKYQAHNLAWFYMKGEWPEEEIDHCDTVEDNNKWENLRLATTSQNGMNRSKRCDNTSGHKGVCWHKNNKRWEVHITKDRHQMYVGQYKEFDKAVEAYQKKAKELFGPYANFN